MSLTRDQELMLYAWVPGTYVIKYLLFENEIYYDDGGLNRNYDSETYVLPNNSLIKLCPFSEEHIDRMKHGDELVFIEFNGIRYPANLDQIKETLIRKAYIPIDRDEIKYTEMFELEFKFHDCLEYWIDMIKSNFNRKINEWVIDQNNRINDDTKKDAPIEVQTKEHEMVLYTWHAGSYIINHLMITNEILYDDNNANSMCHIQTIVLPNDSLIKVCDFTIDHINRLKKGEQFLFIQFNGIKPPPHVEEIYETHIFKGFNDDNGETIHKNITEIEFKFHNCLIKWILTNEVNFYLDLKDWLLKNKKRIVRKRKKEMVTANEIYKLQNVSLL